MAVVDGWLAPSRIAARSPCPRLVACVPTSGWLSGLDPSSDGGPGRPVRANEVEVSISVDADVSVDADTLLPSWFLVRPTGTTPEWEVVGRVAGVVPQVPATGPVSSASSAPPALDGPTLTADELRAAIADGSLDGRVIVVDGRLESMQIPCPAPGACNLLVLHGLDGILVTDDRRPVGAEPPPDRGRLLLVPGGGGLRLLGAAPASLGHPLTVKEAATGISLDPRAVPLEAVSGWIVSRGPVFCPYETEGATPCTASWPWLTDDEPGPGGSLTSDVGVPVRVADPLAGGPLVVPVARGPFLVRRLPDWQVVAVLGTGPVPHATLP